jgi:uncharacterized protein YndB with AHSA1/START domain
MNQITTTERPVVRIERTMAAPPAAVYRAWLEPDLVRQWMCPGDFEATDIQIDARVGGRYRVAHALGGSEAGGFLSEILELVPDRRLVFRWGFAGPQWAEGPVYDSLLTVTFEATADGGTLLTLVHERLDDLAAAMPEAARLVGPGWEEVLGKLAQQR